jgi:hypothetical protein
MRVPGERTRSACWFGILPERTFVGVPDLIVWNADESSLSQNATTSTAGAVRSPEIREIARALLMPS